MELNTYIASYAFPPFTRVRNEDTGHTAVLAGVMFLWKKDSIMYCAVIDGSEVSLWIDQMDLLTGSSPWKVVENEPAEGQ